MSDYSRPFSTGRFAAASAVLFGALLVLVRLRWGPLAALDRWGLARTHAYAVDHPAFVLVMKALSRVGSAPYYWVLVVGLVVWSAWRRAGGDAVFAVLAVGGGELLNLAAKSLVDRVRPVWPDPVATAGGLSFPSGHAQGAMVGYGVLVILLAPALGTRWRRLLVAAAAMMVLAIGFSRVALGVHYPTDVVGGYLLGATWLAALLAIVGRPGCHPAA
ncbi:phosphatase PAP2 family protein [Cryptosporangium sp. NPDC051539]|uniref:phosphatase PAP2 family protein n=1 Tax=Cryptosporangium sp. NPDC051539 TaxID=3363962 RepID=UPI003788C055